MCNLASVNLSTHLVDGEIDWDRLAASTRTAVRQLDNLVDITISSVPQAQHANSTHRAVGLGLMGFTDVTERLGLAYESEASYELIDRITEFVSFHAIDASADLARERGAYPAFEGSGWSKGLVPIDTIARLEADRGVPVRVDRTTRMDWDALRTKVAGGIRNATLMAIAPTASIGLVAGTTPGLDPQFSQIFSRATSSGKFLEVNRNLVKDLQALGLWEQVRDELLAAQGDLDALPSVPDHLKAVYRTSFQLSPYAFVEVAARAQKWVDQAISRNIYLESRDVSQMAALYSAAWERGVKTTYYLHVKPRHTAEQSTVRVNKSEVRAAAPAAGRRGPGRDDARRVLPPDAGSGSASPPGLLRRRGSAGQPSPSRSPRSRCPHPTPHPRPTRRRHPRRRRGSPSRRAPSRSRSPTARRSSTGSPARRTRWSCSSATPASDRRPSSPPRPDPAPPRRSQRMTTTTSPSILGTGISEGLLLKPVRYPWAMDLYDQAVANTWFPHEIQLGEDLADFARMTEEEKHAVTFLMSYFNPNELLVNKALAFGVYPYVNAPEAHLYLAKQMWEEANHCMSFEYVLETFPIDRDAGLRLARRRCPRWRPRRSSRSTTSVGWPSRPSTSPRRRASATSSATSWPTTSSSRGSGSTRASWSR